MPEEPELARDPKSQRIRESESQRARAPEPQSLADPRIPGSQQDAK